MEVKLADIIESKSAISPRSGLKAFDYVSELIGRNEEVTVSFEGIEDCTSAFCGSFIGKLYMNFDPNKVDELFHIADLDESHVWYKKIKNAILLGTNENIRTVRKSSIDDLILS